MHFRISGLDPAPFEPLYGLTEHALRERGVTRRAVQEERAFPDRIELRDAHVGESVLLLNYVSQDAESPYRASHAIFVREGASERYTSIDEVPEVLRRRLLSVRGFSADGMLIGADVSEGATLEPLIERLFENLAIDYLHIHNAREGCYHARVDRAEA